MLPHLPELPHQIHPPFPKNKKVLLIIDDYNTHIAKLEVIDLGREMASSSCPYCHKLLLAHATFEPFGTVL